MWPLVSEERTKQADRAAEGTGRTASSRALWPARGETLKGHSVSSTPGFPGGKQVAPVMNPAAAPAASPEEVGSQGAKFNYRPALKRSPKSASSLPFHFKVLSQKRKVKPSACRGGFISRFSASYMPDPQVGAGSKEKWKRKKKSEKKKSAALQSLCLLTFTFHCFYLEKGCMDLQARAGSTGVSAATSHRPLTQSLPPPTCFNTLLSVS